MIVRSIWPATVALLLAGLSSCKNEGPAASVSAAGSEASEVSENAENAQPAPPDEVAQPGRALWFASGLGRDAILARERRDHAEAVRLLDALLQTDLPRAERAGAQWLRGLEDLQDDRFAAAADRFAEAAEAPELAPVQARLVRLEAQARLDAGQPQRALELVRGVTAKARERSGLAEAFAVIEADALLRTKARDEARKAYEAYLAKHPKGKHRMGVSIKLARMLASEEGDAAAHAKAVKLYESILLEAPLSDYGEEAAGALPDLRKSAGVSRSAKDRAAFERRLAVARMDAMLSARRYKGATKAADALLRKGADEATRCRALYVKGSAIFKQRRRADARATFDRAAASCKKAKGVTTYEVKSRYQGARGLYAAGKYDKAALAFSSLAKEHAKNSYADDAWVLAGESWSEHGDDTKATSAFESALAVDGDMKDEARRRLLLLAFSAGNAARALALCDEALEGAIAHPTTKSKLHYFRGRALASLGKRDAATSAWVDAVQTDPLGYPAAQAMSRLHEAGPEAFERGLAMLQRETPKADAATTSKGAERAVLLARLGLGDDAREELDIAGVRGWPAVAVLNQAGLYAEAQRTLANLGTAWRKAPPGPANLPVWRLAHPRPFAELIDGYEESHGVPDLLAFAVMQTESRFNPGATSWAGARGLIQLMPATAKGVAKKVGVEVDKDDLYDPATNLNLGMHYLAGLVARYGGGPGAVALAIPSYNAGAGAVDKWLRERGGWELDLFIEAIPYDETRKYTQSVFGRWWAYRWIYGEGDPAERVPLLPKATPQKV
ncbi:MAG: transglycosylase SLT domain-containing protein [bacterium]|nr:transglycosylase SLT domain-containing protein [bacterium]